MKLPLFILVALLSTASVQSAILSTNGTFIITNPPQQVTLAWDLSFDPTVVGYNLYYGTNSGQYTKTIQGLTMGTAAVSNLTYSTTYYFAVTSYALNGTNGIIESTFSSEVSYATPSIPNPTLLHKPVKLALQSRPASGMWADTDMFWSFDPTATNEFFRLKIVQQ